MIKKRFDSFNNKKKPKEELNDLLDFYCNKMIKHGYSNLIEEAFS